MRHDLVIPERDNMWAALAWAQATGEKALGLELFVALENYWATSDPRDGQAWAKALLEGDPAVDPRLLSRALRVQGGMEGVLGSIRTERRLLATGPHHRPRAW